MGIEKNRVDQESLEQKPVDSVEQQESDPMIGFEKASAELNDSIEKLVEMAKIDYGTLSDGSGEAMAELLQAEDNEKFSGFKTSLASKYEKLKGILDGIVDLGMMGTMMGAGFVGLLGTGGHFEILVAAVGIELAAGIGLFMRMGDDYRNYHTNRADSYRANEMREEGEESRRNLDLAAKTRGVKMGLEGV